jgi:hypothetical protein
MLRLAPLAAALALCAGPALAEPAPCAPYEVVSAALLEKYHEAPVARFLSDRGFVIEVLASPDGSTATVLGILATGSAYALVPAAVTGNPS